MYDTRPEWGERGQRFQDGGVEFQGGGEATRWPSRRLRLQNSFAQMWREIVRALCKSRGRWTCTAAPAIFCHITSRRCARRVRSTLVYSSRDCSEVLRARDPTDDVTCDRHVRAPPLPPLAKSERETATRWPPECFSCSRASSPSAAPATSTWARSSSPTS